MIVSQHTEGYHFDANQPLRVFVPDFGPKKCDTVFSEDDVQDFGHLPFVFTYLDNHLIFYYIMAGD
jgi:hypothetical protein